jgi:signal transduction histidine kinase
VVSLAVCVLMVPPIPGGALPVACGLTSSSPICLEGDLVGPGPRNDGTPTGAFLLLLARLDAHQGPPTQPVDLSRIVDEAIGSIRRRDITVSAHGPGVPAIDTGDADQLRRMMRNLLHNAEQHAHERIAVDVASDNGIVRVIVSDDGAGIPTDQRGAVFERFVRLDTARSRDVGGTGLGLAIVADVAANHHGTTAITDGEVGGATFVVEIPAATGEPGSTEIEPSSTAMRSRRSR